MIKFILNFLSFALWPVILSADFCSDSLKLPDEGSRDFKILEELFSSYEPYDFSEAPMLFGIELEVVSGFRVHPSKILGIIRTTVVEQIPDLEVLESVPFAFTYRWNDNLYSYQVEDEPAIDAPGGWNGIEIISPTLRSKDDLEVFLKVIKHLRDQDIIRPVPISGGLHIHVSFPAPRWGEVRALVLLFSYIENPLGRAFKTGSQRRRRYANNTDINVLRFVRNLNNEVSVNELVDLMPGRNYGLNLKALHKYQTVEIRVFNSMVDVEKISSAVAFTTGLVWSVRKKYPSLLSVLQDSENLQRIDFGRFAEVINHSYLKIY